MSARNVLNWIARPDLQFFPQTDGRATHYVVKDPVKNEFYQFSRAEYFFLNLLRTPQSIETLIDKAISEMGQPFSIPEVMGLLKRLAFDNLIVSQGLGDGARLWRQQQVDQRNSWKQKVFGLLSLNLGGIHPGALLNGLKPVGQILFHPLTLMVFVFAVVLTAAFALLSLDSLATRVPSFVELSTPAVLIAVFIGFCVAKALHEMGHALACRYFGRECSEIGVMLLIFVPCVYCDVSDMWAERNRWKRLAVTLAGVGVELAVATVCFWIWYLTVPGILHSMCYSLMLITSLNTLFINGNPLMRFDGYYALSDLVKQPNLSAAANQSLADCIRCLFFVETHRGLSNNRNWLLIAYAVLSKIYRTMILLAIGFAAWKFFDFQGLRSFASVAVVLFAMLILVPLAMGWTTRIHSVLKTKKSMGKFRWLNFLLVLGALVVAGWWSAQIEISQRVWGMAQLQLNRPHYLFTTWNGHFEATVFNGQHVRQGELLGRIRTVELEDQNLSLESQLQEARQNLHHAQLESNGVSAAARIEFWSQRAENLVRQLDENRLRSQELEVRSPIDGQLVAAHFGLSAQGDERLPQKFGAVFDPDNRDCQVSRGDLIGYIGNPKMFRGILRVDQKEIELVRIGQTVKILIPFQSEPVWGTVAEIAIEDQTATQAQSKPAQGESQQIDYQVVIEFDRHPALIVGSECRVIIYGEPTHLIGYVGRWLRNSFWF